MVELTPTIIIGLITVSVLLLGTFAAIIAVFVRQETKISDTITDIRDLWQAFEKHCDDRSIHIPDTELERRFTHIDQSISAIQKGIDKIGDRFDQFLNK